MRLFCLILVWMFLPLAAQAAALPKPALVTSVEGITEYRLANGLQVLLVPDDGKPTTTVNLTFRVGSRHENYGETGMAHLLEHLIFKGSPKYPLPWGELNRRGFQFNGTTSWDRTNYFASFAVNDDNQRWYLGWLADATVNSFIAKKDLDTEMTVVRNEMERGENSPGRILFEKTMATMFQWHNYGKSTIGARSDVENVDIARLQAFYRTHYRPDNATLIVSGKFNPDSTLRWVQDSFGKLVRPAAPLRRTYTLDAVQDGERSVTLRRVGGTPMVLVGYHVPPGPHPDYPAVDLLTNVLAEPPAGRLHKALVDSGRAAAVFGYAVDLAEPGAVFLGAPSSAPARTWKPPARTRWR
jgi:zinc protease